MYLIDVNIDLEYDSAIGMMELINLTWDIP